MSAFQRGRRVSAARLTLAALALAVIASAAALLAAPPEAAHAQELSPELQARALTIERQLLCPQCTNKRLDVCELAICIDMREQIGEQLARGRTNDEIIFFFSNRYGQRVLADIPREGFNLVLFGWVGASFLLMTVGGALFLLQLRRSGRAYRAARAAGAGPPAASPEDEAWLDAELSEGHR